MTWCPIGSVCGKNNSRLCKKPTFEEAQEFLRNHLQWAKGHKDEHLGEDKLDELVAGATYEIWPVEDTPAADVVVEDEIPDSNARGSDHKRPRRGGGAIGASRPKSPQLRPAPLRQSATDAIAAAVTAGVTRALTQKPVPPPPVGHPPLALGPPRPPAGPPPGAAFIGTPGSSSGSCGILDLLIQPPQDVRSLIQESADTAFKAAAGARQMATICAKASKAFEHEAMKQEAAQTRLMELIGSLPRN